MWGDMWGSRRRWGVDKVGMCFDRHESSVKLSIKWGAGVVANESAECYIRSSRAATTKSIAKKASPADPLTRLCKPLVDSAAA